MNTEKGWICNKCEVGVLDPDKRVRAQNDLEFVVICPNCGAENPTISFTSDDDDFPKDSIKIISGGLKDCCK